MSSRRESSINGTRVSIKSVSEMAEKAEEESNKSSTVSGFKPWQVFVNHIDSYHGKKLAEFLSEREYVNPESGREGYEEEEEEQEDEEDERMLEGKSKDDMKRGRRMVEMTRKCEVIGTTIDPEYRQPEDVTMIIRNPKDREAYLAELMNCGIMVFDITQSQDQIAEAQWALKAIVRELEKMEQKTPKAFKRNEDVRYFVLISTLMTWAHTKPLDPEEPDLPFTEADYRKRKPHPNFKRHIQCEKDVIIIKKKPNLMNKLKTVVVCSAIMYGEEEGALHYLFKMGWHTAPFLPIFGPGNNKIPLIHVRDLVKIVFDVLQNWPPVQYIVATEQEVISQNTIVKKISKILTTGKVKRIPQEEAFLLPEVTQETYDVMTMNLNIDPVYIVDRISWELDIPFRESANAIVKEFKVSRNLLPVKIIVLGPPAVGKTKIAMYLHKHYDIPYLHVKSLITDTIEQLKSEIEEAAVAAEQGDPEEGEDDVVEDEEEDLDEPATTPEELQELLDEIERNMQRSNGRLEDDLVNKLFQRKLRSKQCLNQGYVIDGYPKTLEQAKELFGSSNEADDDIDEEVDAADEANVNYAIVPELIVSLEASDEFLKERVINLPEKVIQGTHYTEENMMRRLQEYRQRNTEENTPVQFFDENEIHPLIIDAENDVCPDMFPSIYQCLERLGLPRNYGFTAEDAEARRRDEEEENAAQTSERLKKEKEMLERKKQREEKMAEWTGLMEILKEEEEKRLCVLGLPLRHYLVNYVFPTLTKGLLEVARLRPDDPVDYLAEYLFKENPEGKMFAPDYTQTMCSVLDVIEKYRDEILPPEELNEKIMKYLRNEAMVSEQDEASTIGTDVCISEKMVPCVTPSFSYDEVEAYEGEGDTGSDKTGCCGDRIDD